MSSGNLCFQLLAIFNLLLIVVTGSRPYLDMEPGADLYTMESDSFTSSQTTEAECSLCYKALVINLLKNSTNFFNLQTAFFPSNNTTPDFVIVTYHYDSETNVSSPEVNKTVWFWSSAVYFFYHPIRIFQFTSLVFSDPLLQQSNLDLYLPAECSKASDAYMKLLTQRLKLYAMRQKLYAPIDDNYQAKSHSVSTLIQWHKEHSHVSRLVLSAQILFPFLAMLFMTLFFIYAIELEPCNLGKRLNKQINSSVDYISASGEAKILIILTISVLFNICTLITDGFALKEYHKLAPRIKEYYYHNSFEFRCFYIIPILMTVFDSFSPLFIAVPVGLVLCRYYIHYNDNTAKVKWSNLLYTLLSPFSCIANHAYHVIIAFIDNAYHASSVLLLFIIVLFVHVVVFQNIYYYVFKWQNTRQPSNCCTKFYWVILILGCYLVGVLTLAVIIGLTVAMLILLPINNAINNAPSNIYIIYQGSVAVIAALVTFQVFFRETNSIAEVFIKARDKMILNRNTLRENQLEAGNNDGQGIQPDPEDEKWNEMSEKEKELYLAEMLLKYVLRKTQRAQDLGNPRDPGNPPDPGNLHVRDPGNQQGRQGPGNQQAPGNEQGPGNQQILEEDHAVAVRPDIPLLN